MKGFKLWEPNLKKIFINRDVDFDDQFMFNDSVEVDVPISRRETTNKRWFVRMFSFLNEEVFVWFKKISKIMVQMLNSYMLRLATINVSMIIVFMLGDFLLLLYIDDMLIIANHLYYDVNWIFCWERSLIWRTCVLLKFFLGLKLTWIGVLESLRFLIKSMSKNVL